MVGDKQLTSSDLESIQRGTNTNKENYMTIPQLDKAIEIIDKKIEGQKDAVLVARLKDTRRKYVTAKTKILNYYTKHNKNHELVGMKNKIFVAAFRDQNWFKQRVSDLGNAANIAVDAIEDHKGLIVGAGATIGAGVALGQLMNTTLKDGRTIYQAIKAAMATNPALAAFLKIFKTVAITAAVCVVVSKIPAFRNNIRKGRERAAARKEVKNEVMQENDKNSYDASLNEELAERKNFSDETIEKLLSDENLLNKLKDYAKDSKSPLVKAYIMKQIARVNEAKLNQNKEIAGAARQTANIHTRESVLKTLVDSGLSEDFSNKPQKPTGSKPADPGKAPTNPGTTRPAAPGAEPEKIEDWIAANPEPQKVEDWIAANPEPQKVEDWIAANPEPPAVAAWVTANPEPQTVADWEAANPEPPFIADWETANPEPQTVADWEATNPEPQTVAAWVTANPEPQTVAAWVTANPEPQTVADWEAANPKLTGFSAIKWTEDRLKIEEAHDRWVDDRKAAAQTRSIWTTTKQNIENNHNAWETAKQPIENGHNTWVTTKQSIINNHNTWEANRQTISEQHEQWVNDRKAAGQTRYTWTATKQNIENNHNAWETAKQPIESGHNTWVTTKDSVTQAHINWEDAKKKHDNYPSEKATYDKWAEDKKTFDTYVAQETAFNNHEKAMQDLAVTYGYNPADPDSKASQNAMKQAEQALKDAIAVSKAKGTSEAIDVGLDRS